MDFGWLSILPPIIAIVLSLITGEVLISLFIAVLAGAIIVTGSPVTGFTQTLNKYMVESLTDSWNISILIFCISIGGLIGILQKNGGTKGIADIIVKRAKNQKSTLFMTWLMGVAIFFDDYANTLIVGSTMRNITDKMKISREKLAYIVDSTAAPVSSIALVSTWVGFETGLINDGLTKLGLDMGAYDVFLQTIPYRFYSLLAIAFVLMIIFTGKDFGPMKRAEEEFRRNPISEEASLVEEVVSGKWYNAVLPIITVLLVTLFGLFANGGGLTGASVREAFGAADASVVLPWASFAGVIVAMLLTLVQRIMNVEEVMNAFIEGIKSMTVASLILVLAWSLGGVNKTLGTADFIVNVSKGVISPSFLPLIMFALPCVVAFSTGSSWGANSIVMPIAIPMAFEFGGPELLVPVIGAVLTGAVFGDHCSPISDTTIMSSMASGCDHIKHVKTQMPYALTVAGVSVLVGFVPAGFGFNPYISLLIGVAALFVLLNVFSKGHPTTENTYSSLSTKVQGAD